MYLEDYSYRFRVLHWPDSWPPDTAVAAITKIEWFESIFDIPTPSIKQNESRLYTLCQHGRMICHMVYNVTTKVWQVHSTIFKGRTAEECEQILMKLQNISVD